MNSTNALLSENLNIINEISKGKKISPDDPNYTNYTHCSHVMIYARTKSKFLNFCNKIALVLMQMRLDGFIGFPGGVVDPGESPVEAVNREIEEESGWIEENGPVYESDYQFTHVDEENKKVLHFYAVEVDESKIQQIEQNSLKALEYGEEVLGHFRVPLYTLNDSYSGFPAFLKNNFVGNAKAQLLETLIRQNILSPEDILKALEWKK